MKIFYYTSHSKSVFYAFLDDLHSQNTEENQLPSQRLQWKFSPTAEKQRWVHELLNYVSRTSDEDLARGVSTEILGSEATDAGGVTVDVFRVAVQDFIASSKTFEGDTIKFLRNLSYYKQGT